MEIKKKVFKIIHEKPFTSILILMVFLFFLTQPTSFQKVKIVFFFFLNLFFLMVLKKIVKRKRPRVTSQTKDYSFPSGHAQISSFITISFFLINELTLFITLPILFLVCYNRLEDKHHHLTDVLAGLIFGLFLSPLFF